MAEISVHMSEDKPTYDQLLAENAALRKENRLLRQQLGITAPQQAESVDQPPLQEAFPHAAINKNSPAEEKIALFMSLFRGREDAYAKRWYSTTKKTSGYSPVCLNEWAAGICDKKRNKCAVCPNRKLAPLDNDAIFQHLSGNNPHAADVVGLYPMTTDECCYFLAIDFDGAGWQEDVAAFKSACNELGLTAAVERSRSGNGGHIWFFFADKILAATARKFGSALLTQAMSRRHEIKFTSYDRFFPNQDIMPSGGFGNLIALPLQGLARKSGHSLFVDDNFAPYADQWAFLSCLPKLSQEEVEGCIKRLDGHSELGILTSLGDEKAPKPWEKAKAEPALTLFDFPQTVQIVKANMLHIAKNGVSQNALNRIKRLGAFRNPDFYKAQAMRLPTYNKPRIIDCTEESAEYLSIPRGCEAGLLTLLDDANAVYQAEDMRNPGEPIEVQFNGNLRPEQMIAANSLLQHETGILSATTAFGKTVVGAYIIAEKKVNALVLVHTSALLEQWKKSLARFLDINETLPEEQKKRGRKKELSIIGRLGGAKNDLHGKIDIAIMQSLVSGEEVKELVKDYGLVLVDECHHVSAVSFEKILKTAGAQYVYGLTATPTRQDGQHPIIIMQCGEIRYQVDAKAQAAKAGFQRFVAPRFTSFKKPVGIEDKDFTITKIYAAIAENVRRNKMIIADVQNALDKGRTPIILTQRAAHVDLLAAEIEKFCPNVIRLIGKASAKEKRETLERLQDIGAGEQFVLVATGKYVGEGFDEPRLDTLFLAAPISWKGTLQQYTGRLHRACEGKEDVIVYDYVDVHVAMLERMYYKRVLGYADMGYKALSEDESIEKAGLIFDNRSFLPVFEEDIRSAKHEIIIISPYLRKIRTTQMLRLLAAALINGVSVTVITRPAENYKLAAQPDIFALIQTLADAGVKVIEKPNIHQKFAVIDQNIVWYGSINFLSFGRSEESVMRFENMEIAGELAGAIG
jgi:superfamily II DNA or RNA helicase